MSKRIKILARRNKKKGRKKKYYYLISFLSHVYLSMKEGRRESGGREERINRNTEKVKCQSPFFLRPIEREERGKKRQPILSIIIHFNYTHSYFYDCWMCVLRKSKMCFNNKTQDIFGNLSSNGMFYVNFMASITSFLCYLRIFYTSLLSTRIHNIVKILMVPCKHQGLILFFPS